ncbi:MAG: hypothetical protein U1A25_03395, partial [Candidatus Sungbacteria bacterium]|nr:hypothetical protein [Candidatus Sungbacteria bacterium]
MSNLEQNKKIDLQEAVSILGVSSATIRNWVKHDFIQLETRNSQLFDYRSIKELRNKIEGGEILRLHSRANKRNSTATFLPVEYIDKKENIDSIKQIVSSF